MPQSWNPSAKIWIKTCIFQRTVEIKQPHAMTGPKKFPQRLSGIAYNSISVCCYGRAFAKGCVIEAVDALFLETPKESPKKYLNHGVPQRKFG